MTQKRTKSDEKKVETEKEEEKEKERKERTERFLYVTSRVRGKCVRPCIFPRRSSE